jgi:hypothetical protein
MFKKAVRLSFRQFPAAVNFVTVPNKVVSEGAIQAQSLYTACDFP